MFLFRSNHFLCGRLTHWFGKSLTSQTVSCRQQSIVYCLTSHFCLIPCFDSVSIIFFVCLFTIDLFLCDFLVGFTTKFAERVRRWCVCCVDFSFTWCTVWCRLAYFHPDTRATLFLFGSHPIARIRTNQCEWMWNRMFNCLFQLICGVFSDILVFFTFLFWLML